MGKKLDKLYRELMDWYENDYKVRLRKRYTPIEKQIAEALEVGDYEEAARLNKLKDKSK